MISTWQWYKGTPLIEFIWQFYFFSEFTAQRTVHNLKKCNTDADNTSS
jgi:hypothetical protein